MEVCWSQSGYISAMSLVSPHTTMWPAMRERVYDHMEHPEYVGCEISESRTRVKQANDVLQFLHSNTNFNVPLSMFILGNDASEVTTEHESVMKKVRSAIKKAMDKNKKMTAAPVAEEEEADEAPDDGGEEPQNKSRKTAKGRGRGSGSKKGGGRKGKKGRGHEVDVDNFPHLVGWRKEHAEAYKAIDEDWTEPGPSDPPTILGTDCAFWQHLCAAKPREACKVRYWMIAKPDIMTSEYESSIDLTSP